MDERPLRYQVPLSCLRLEVDVVARTNASRMHKPREEECHVGQAEQERHTRRYVLKYCTCYDWSEGHHKYYGQYADDMEQEKHFKTEAKALPNVHIVGIFLHIVATRALEQD